MHSAANTYIFNNTKYGGGDISISTSITYTSPNSAVGGVFTPILFDSAGAVTFTQASTGYYLRTGNLVFCNFNIAISGVVGSGGGGLRISGLPFTSNASTGTVVVPLSVSSVDIPVGYLRAVAVLTQGQSVIFLRAQGDNIADAALPTSSATNMSSFIGSFMYRV